MEAVKIIITIVYILVCAALVVVVLMQEGKNAGLSGALSGSTDTYWSKNKGRSMEGTLSRITKVLALLFLVLSVVMNMQWFVK